jgi:hypothetical protein
MLVGILAVLVIIATLLIIQIGMLDSIDQALRTLGPGRQRLPWESDGSTFNVVKTPGSSE